MRDEVHLLNHLYKLLKSGKKLSVPKQRANRFSNTFVPFSVKNVIIFYVNDVQYLILLFSLIVILYLHNLHWSC